MSIEAMKLALEALELFCEYGTMDRPIERRDALRAAIEQAEKQEPVAWQCQEHGDTEWFNCSKEAHELNPRRYIYRALYTAPPQREWVGLTDEEMRIFVEDFLSPDKSAREVFNAIEAKLKEKNA
jgi:hypothetical protein